MKFLKYTLIVIAILVAGFFSLGIIKSEITYNCEITVDKPLAESWAVSQDDSKLSEWLEGFQKYEDISGTPGTVGAVSDVYFDNNGEVMSIRETITEIIPNESVSMLFEMDFMNMDYTLSMINVDGQTKINSSSVVKGNGMFAKSFIALMGGTFSAQEDNNLNNLKQTIEENTKEY
ncbi:MAG: SRPBCC family protein [Vicingaceae bacterium]